MDTNYYQTNKGKSIEICKGLFLNFNRIYGMENDKVNHFIRESQVFFDKTALIYSKLYWLIKIIN